MPKISKSWSVWWWVYCKCIKSTNITLIQSYLKMIKMLMNYKSLMMVVLNKNFFTIPCWRWRSGRTLSISRRTRLLCIIWRKTMKKGLDWACVLRSVSTIVSFFVMISTIPTWLSSTLLLPNHIRSISSSLLKFRKWGILLRNNAQK